MPADLLEQIKQLNSMCTKSIEDLQSSELRSNLGTSLTFLSDLDAWSEILSTRPEGSLHRSVSTEYALSLLNVCQGQYRNAFKALRLVLELSMQSTYLSANLVELSEWKNGDLHTKWSLLTHLDNGPLGKRFCRAFFPEMEEHSTSTLTIACKVYTELSECIHGNIPLHIPLPTEIKFQSDTLKLWIDRADTVRYVVMFGLTTRYLRYLTVTEKEKLQSTVNDNLGHIAAVRKQFEGLGSE